MKTGAPESTRLAPVGCALILLLAAPVSSGTLPHSAGAAGAVAEVPLVVRSGGHEVFDVTKVHDRTIVETDVGPETEDDFLIELVELGFTGGLPAGAVPTVTPSTLILGAGESQPVQVDLQIDNTTVPFAPEEPLSYEAYEGALQIEAPGSQLYRLPLAFLKSPILKLSWDEEPFVVSIYETEGSEGLVARFSFPGTEEELLLPQSTYDIVTLFRGGGTHRVFREAVPVADRTVLSIERAEARHSLTLTPVDENGEPLTPFNLVRDETTILMRHRTSSSDIFGGASASTLWFSDVSDAFLFEIGLFIRRGATYTFFTHEDQGIAPPVWSPTTRRITNGSRLTTGSIPASSRCSPTTGSRSSPPTSFYRAPLATRSPSPF